VGMNALLLQMLVARGNGGNPAIAEAIARMGAGGNGNLSMDPQQLLARLGNGNPAASALAKHFEELKANASKGEGPQAIDVPPSDEDSATTAERMGGIEDDSDALTALRQQMDTLVAELRVQRERNDLLAQALGACCMCWGQSQECRYCRGQGTPGFCLPDEALVMEYVVPAIRTLRAQKAKTREVVAAQARAAERSASGKIANSLKERG
jgi:hypothetical protein